MKGGRALFFFALFSVFTAAFPPSLPAQSSSPSSNKDDKEGWALSACAFTLFGVPEEYASYASVMPLLIIERLGEAQQRFVDADERRERELRDLYNKRMTLTEERRNLIYSRDSLFFSFDDDDEKEEKREEYDELIKEKNKEIAELERQIRGEPPLEEKGGKRKKRKSKKTAEKPNKENVAVTFRVEDEAGLYTPQKGVSLAQSLYRDGISAILTGEIRDVGGYMYAFASLETGYGAIASERIYYAGHYDDLEDAVEFLALSLLSQVSNREPVLLYISANPKTATVSVDGVMVHNIDEPVAVFAGAHTIEASAQGYASSVLTKDFTESDEFSVDISLLPIASVNVAFDAGEQATSLFLRTKYFGETPQEVELPAIPQIGEVVYGDVQTFFIFNPNEEIASGGAVRAAVSPDAQTAEKRISRQRKILYWSLGALYLALPAAFLLTGEANARTIAYNEGRITDAESIKPWTIAGNVSVGVCIALGVNLVVQAIIYLVRANQVIPRQAELR